MILTGREISCSATSPTYYILKKRKMEPEKKSWIFHSYWNLLPKVGVDGFNLSDLFAMMASCQSLSILTSKLGLWTFSSILGSPKCRRKHPHDISTTFIILGERGHVLGHPELTQTKYLKEYQNRTSQKSPVHHPLQHSISTRHKQPQKNIKTNSPQTQKRRFSKNRDTPKSSILIGFSIIFTIHFRGTPLFLETPNIEAYPFPPYVEYDPPNRFTAEKRRPGAKLGDFHYDGIPRVQGPAVSQKWWFFREVLGNPVHPGWCVCCSFCLFESCIVLFHFS